jgi:hypothetical protein
MEGVELQEKVTVRCTAKKIFKSELSSDSAKKWHSYRIRYSCSSAPLLEVGRSSINGPGDGNNHRLVPTGDGTRNPFTGIENKQCKNPNYSLEKYNTSGLDSKTSKIKQIDEVAIRYLSKF